MLQQYRSPLLLNSDKNIAEAFFRVAEYDQNFQLYSQAAPSSQAYLARSISEVASRVRRVANFLISKGVRPGDKVAILSNTRPEWMEADLAILSCGAVVVSVYQSLPAHDIGFILLDSNTKVVFAENKEQVGKLFHLLSAPCPMPATEDRSATEMQVVLDCIVSFESVESHDQIINYQKVLDISDPISELPYKTRLAQDLASLVYTSGTTGPPKGVMQTHTNHLANVRQAFEAQMFYPGERIFLFLPLAHSFAKLMGYISFLAQVHLIFPTIGDKASSKADPQLVMKDLAEANANIVPIVPRILEKLQEGLIHKSQLSGVGALLLRFAILVANEFYQAKQQTGLAYYVWLWPYVLTRFIRRKIKTKLFGSKLKCVISGGAKLPTAVAHFFTALNVQVLEGYGLTETCVATNVNRRGQAKIGTVGPVMANDIEMRTLEDGEVIFRGPNIALGYYNRPTATRQAWDSQGWFHTGDLGEIDLAGNLSIVGRKKELIVSSNGKKIAPDPIEQKLKSSKYISQALMFGEAKAYCVALILPNITAINSWAARQAIKLGTEVLTSPQVKDLIWREVEAVNAGLAGFEQIRKVELINEDFSLENGLLTPTFKIKRKEVYIKYQQIIQAMYS